MQGAAFPSKCSSTLSKAPAPYDATALTEISESILKPTPSNRPALYDAPTQSTTAAEAVTPGLAETPSSNVGHRGAEQQTSTTLA